MSRHVVFSQQWAGTETHPSIKTIILGQKLYTHGLGKLLTKTYNIYTMDIMKNTDLQMLPTKICSLKRIRLFGMRMLINNGRRGGTQKEKRILNAWQNQ